MTDGQTIDVSLLDNFSREAKTWAALDDHEAIVTVLDWGTTPQPWIALEFMQGDLRSRLPLTQETAIDVLCEVADALQHAHRHGVAHRDLKPENVLFATDLSDSVRVGDWGLAKVLLDHSQSTTGMTPTYAAPEQFTDRPTTAKEHQMTDIYQLGAISYEVFTGQPPFQGSTFEVMEKIKNADLTPVSEIDASLPDELDDILLRALAKDPADRFDTAVHFRERLQSL
jgi:serine/threonine protein kinase